MKPYVLLDLLALFSCPTQIGETSWGDVNTPVSNARREAIGAHRGRTASCPNRPRADPGVPFSSTGLFRNTRFRVRHQDTKRGCCPEPSLLSPAVRLALLIPALRRRTMFPMPASYSCPPLPLVNGATVSEYCGRI